MNRLPLPAVPAALLALLLTAATLALRLAMDGPLGGRPTLVIFTVPIMLSAYAGGLRGGLWSTALTYLFASWFLLAPLQSFEVASRVDLWQLLCVVLAGVVISVLNEAVHRARRRADLAVQAQERLLATDDSARKQVEAERQQALAALQDSEQQLRKVIDERVRADEALLQASALQNAIFNSANFSSIATDAQGVIQIFNVGAERMLGYAAADVVNRLTPADISDPQELILRAKELSAELEAPIAPGFEALVFKASRGIVDIYELTYVRKDGSRFPAVVSVTALREAGQAIIGYLLIGTDNSARWQAVEAQRETDALLRTIHLHSIVSVTDHTGRIVEVNDSFCKISGYSRDELLGQTHRIVNSGVQDRAFWMQMWKCIAAGIPWRGEICNRTKRGSLYWVDSIIVPFVGADGRATKFVSIRTDVTAARLAVTLAQASEARYRMLFEYAPHGILISSDESDIVDANPSLCRMLGYARNELIGLKGHKIVAPSEVQQVASALEKLRSEGRLRREWTFRRRDDSTFVVELDAAYMPDGNRLSMVIDITERKQVEASLREATRRAEEANRAKSDFLANTSHEIRTPMNAVIGLSYLLGQTVLDAPQRKLLAKVHLASKSLLGVLNNVLDLSKIEANELIVDRAPFSLPRLLQEVEDLMSAQAEAKGIAFEIDAEHGLPQVLEGDAARMAQVLTNLLSNAIKFTDRGRVDLRVHRLEAAGPQVRLCFEVQDSGIGIAADVQARLFEPFVQADASITRRFGGTGLGLSIVKHLVALMGGTVQLRSSPGAGSVFAVALDLGVAAVGALGPRQAEPRAADGRALEGVRVLVVDDSDINLEVTQRILELEGARVGLAGSGEQALALLGRNPGAFDIVLMDVQMPGLDGHDAARRIRSELALSALPVIALTAGALSSERQKASDAGMDDYIVKPFDPPSLVRSILRHVRPAEPAAASAASDGAPVTDAPLAAQWQEIEGIDALDARQRFGSDFVLFRTLLKRMLAEFHGPALALVLPDPDPDPASPSQLALLGGRLHKLRGVAGMLGATAVQQGAELAEASCAAGDAGRTLPLLAALAEQLQCLQRDAAPALAAADVEADAHAVAQRALSRAGGGITPQALLDFTALLRGQSLSALDRFAELAPLLRRQLGADHYQALHTHMELLQFSQAADLLAPDRLDAA